MNSPTTVLTVDDNAIMLLGLTEAIAVDPGLQSVGSAVNATEALAVYRQFEPDVVTMDYEMPGESGIECTRMILAEFPDARIILLSVHNSEEDVWQAVQAGVKGYLTKKAGEIKDVLEAVHEVAKGGTFFPAAIAEKMENRRSQDELTPRELEILQMLGKGLSNKELMSHFNLSLSSIKHYLTKILDKLGAADRTHAVIIAFQRGILKVDP